MLLDHTYSVQMAPQMSLDRASDAQMVPQNVLDCTVQPNRALRMYLDRHLCILTWSSECPLTIPVQPNCVLRMSLEHNHAAQLAPQKVPGPYLCSPAGLPNWSGKVRGGAGRGRKAGQLLHTAQNIPVCH